MAHYAYASPDRQSVLIVEMGRPTRFVNHAGWRRLMERSAGREVGPRGVCTSAAWSPDGQWMYFARVRWRELAPLAPEVSRRCARADHLRPQ